MRIVHPFPQPSRSRADALFLDARYPEWRRRAGLPPAEHTGIDYNLLGTYGNSDLGYPVVAVADGVVTHAAFHRVWGNIVLIHHPQLGLWTQYAHLQHICVEEGRGIWAGEPVGSVGRGDPMAPYIAHLHFEIRRTDLPPDYWPGMNREAILKNYIDPQQWLMANVATEHRFERQGLVMWTPSGRRSIPGKTVVNLEDDTLVHVRTLKDF